MRGLIALEEVAIPPVLRSCVSGLSISKSESPTTVLACTATGLFAGETGRDGISTTGCRCFDDLLACLLVSAAADFGSLFRAGGAAAAVREEATAKPDELESFATISTSSSSSDSMTVRCDLPVLAVLLNVRLGRSASSSLSLSAMGWLLDIVSRCRLHARV